MRQNTLTALIEKRGNYCSFGLFIFFPHLLLVAVEVGVMDSVCMHARACTHTHVHTHAQIRRYKLLNGLLGILR